MMVKCIEIHLFKRTNYQITVQRYVLGAKFSITCRISFIQSYHWLYHYLLILHTVLQEFSTLTAMFAIWKNAYFEEFRCRYFSRSHFSVMPTFVASLSAPPIWKTAMFFCISYWCMFFMILKGVKVWFWVKESTRSESGNARPFWLQYWNLN